jgi:hypothetical protein
VQEERPHEGDAVHFLPEQVKVKRRVLLFDFLVVEVIYLDEEAELNIKAQPKEHEA